MIRISSDKLRARYADRMPKAEGMQALSDEALDAVAGGRDFTMAEIADWFSITDLEVPDSWGQGALARLDAVYNEWFNMIDELPDGAPTQRFSDWAKANYGITSYFD